MKIYGFIPCAGYGKRMGGLTESTPKPLLTVNGIPLIYYSLFLYHLWDIRKIFINLHYLPDKISAELKRYPYADLIFSNEPEILGTAGGIRNAVREEGVGLIVKNPDTLLFPDFYIQDDILNIMSKCPTSLLYLSHRGIDSDETGLELLDKESSVGRVIFSEKGAYFYTGLSFINTDTLSSLSPGSREELGVIWRRNAEQGLLYGKGYSGTLSDVGNRDKYLAIRTKSVIPESMNAEWQKFIGGLS